MAEGVELCGEAAVAAAGLALTAGAVTGGVEFEATSAGASGAGAAVALAAGGAAAWALARAAAAAKLLSEATGLLLSSSNGGKPGNTLSGTYPSTPFAA